MLTWFSRCLPGFSIITLVFLLVCAFSDLVKSRLWRAVFPPWVGQPLHGGWWNGLSPAQSIFVVYCMMIHLHMFTFCLRLGWSILRLTARTKEALGRRFTEIPLDSPYSSPSDEGYDSQPLSPVSLPSPDPFNEKLSSVNVPKGVAEDELTHAIILPNYCEDLHTLETTLRVLASHPRARSQYEVSLLET